MSIAVIPARGGSKRLPRKNIKPFCGRPMITWPISAALESGLFEHVLVSTDDEEIACLARANGAEVPFMRPAQLASDDAATVPVITHAVEEMRGRGWFGKFACCIYPCTPFVRPSDIAGALSLLETSNADFVYPVVEYAHPTFRAMRRTASGKMEFVFPECEMMRTQDLKPTFHDAGQFYWGKADAWAQGKRMHTAGIGMVVPAWRFVDIDNESDWTRAELMFEAGLGRRS